MSLYTYIYEPDVFEAHILLDDICDVANESETSDLKLELLSQITAWVRQYKLKYLYNY